MLESCKYCAHVNVCPDKKKESHEADNKMKPTVCSDYMDTDDALMGKFMNMFKQQTKVIRELVKLEKEHPELKKEIQKIVRML